MHSIKKDFFHNKLKKPKLFLEFVLFLVIFFWWNREEKENKNHSTVAFPSATLITIVLIVIVYVTSDDNLSFNRLLVLVSRVNSQETV